MTVNFRRLVAVVALWLLITAGNPAKSYANDGLKTNRYRNTVDRSSTVHQSSRSTVASQVNPLRPIELQGTIETLENRNPVTSISHSTPVTLRAMYPTDALALLTRSNIGSVSTLTMKAESRSITSNQIRIFVDRPSMSMAIVKQTFDFSTRIHEATNSFFEACSARDSEIERQLAVPASLAVQKRIVPGISASFSRPSVIPKKPVQPRTPLKSPGGSNYRVLLIESAEVELTPSKSHSISGSATESMFISIGTIARTVQHFVDPYWDYVQTFDLLKRLQSIPPWVFSAMWPEYLGRSVSPYGILL